MHNQYNTEIIVEANSYFIDAESYEHSNDNMLPSNWLSTLSVFILISNIELASTMISVLY